VNQRDLHAFLAALKGQRIPPAPRRSRTNWWEFVRQHGAQMLATELFTVETAWLQHLHLCRYMSPVGSSSIQVSGRPTPTTCPAPSPCPSRPLLLQSPLTPRVSHSAGPCSQRVQSIVRCVHIPTEFVQPFRSNPNTNSGVFEHRGEEGSVAAA